MKKTISTISVFMLFVVFAIAQQTAVVVNYYENSKGTSINVPQDKILVFNLPVKPSNGYVWEVADMNGNILAQDPQLHYTTSKEEVGSEGFSQLRFMAKRAGTTNVKLVYHRPWEKVKAVEEVSYTVTAEGAYAGSVKFENAQYEAAKLRKEDYEVKALPATYSLLSLGYLTTVKNQGSCGSCWAFAACGVFESAIKKGDGVTRDLSEQWMVNCGGSFGHNGCSGGFNPFDMYNNGAVYEQDCPYQGVNGSCGSYPKHEKIQSWSYISGSSSVPSTAAIKQAIYDRGALWVAVASSGMSNYTGGVWQGNGTTQCDHAVVLVGWDDNNQCWIMRNSWGTSWGENNGYMRIRYGANSIGYAASWLVYQGSGNDTQAPTAPGNLGSSNITSSSVTLSWSASTDNVGVTGYDIYRNGSVVTTVTGTTANITGLAASTTYSFYVKAKDAAGNVSSASNTINVTTLNGGGDTYCAASGNDYSYEWISKVELNGQSKSSNASGYSDFTSTIITLVKGVNSVTLTPGFSSSSYNESWKIWIDLNDDKDFDDSGEQLFSQSGSSAVSGTITIPTTASGQKRMRITMRYNAAPATCGSFDYGEVEDYTVSFSGGGTDTEAPTAPSNLASNGITSSSVGLSWTGSTDNVGVTGYEVYQNGALKTTVTGTSTTVSGLAASTTYSFYVKAKDAAGNVSRESNTVSVTTSGGQTNYCASRGSNSSYFWINYVGLNNMTNTSGNNNGYADFTSKVASIAPGASATLYLQSGYSYTIYTVYWAIWIDYNQNGTFETTEKILSGSTATSSQVSGTFTVPASALQGTTRMRVSMKYGSEATSCETFSYGEVEDYTINISYQAQTVVASSGDALELGNVSDVSSIYPVPVRNTLNIKFNASLQSEVKVYSATGALVKTFKASSNEMSVDVSELASGVYLLQYRNELENVTEKFIKE